MHKLDVLAPQVFYGISHRPWTQLWPLLGTPLALQTAGLCMGCASYMGSMKSPSLADLLHWLAP